MIFYFGTFNPVHLGHIKIADSVKKAYNDKVVFVPAYDSPWKPDLKNSFESRCKMIELCNQEVCRIEKDLPTPSYTYQTVEILSETWGTVKIIVGYDQYFSLPKWKNPDILKKLCKFIVIPREIGVSEEEINDKLQSMNSEGWESELFKIPLINISSSEIRKTLVQNKASNDISPDVLRYIKENSAKFLK
ncbi:MAG: nicotinate (nicotinamide) nucleotide adenylyltransferase [bacterium]|nr:nicotinate (nicotinamide) nucleotide adenylyltransferase [bacterium]